MKQLAITGPQLSDVCQLLFYMLGIFINRAIGTDEANVHFSVSKFYNILDRGVLQSECLAIFSFINIILDTK